MEYEDLTKRQKIKLIKRVHKKLKLGLDLDIEEINFVMSVADFACYQPHRISEFLYKNRNVSFDTICDEHDKYDFYWKKAFRILCLDKNLWEPIVKIVNRYVSIREAVCVKFNIVDNFCPWHAYTIDINIPSKLNKELTLKVKEIYEKETKKYRKAESRFMKNLKTSDKTKAMFETADDEDEFDRMR